MTAWITGASPRAPYWRTEEVDLHRGRGYALLHGAGIALGTLALLGVRVFLRS